MKAKCLDQDNNQDHAYSLRLHKWLEEQRPGTRVHVLTGGNATDAALMGGGEHLPGPDSTICQWRVVLPDGTTKWVSLTDLEYGC